MERLDALKTMLGEAMVLPLVGVDLPSRPFKHGTVKLAIERHQVPDFARTIGNSHPDAEVVVLPADVATALLDELEHLDRVEPRLQAPGAMRDVTWPCNGTALRVLGDAGWRIWLQRDHSDRDPCWYGSETRMDSMGVAWTRQLGRHVMDDFGTLVKVEGGGQ